MCQHGPRSWHGLEEVQTNRARNKMRENTVAFTKVKTCT